MSKLTQDLRDITVRLRISGDNITANRIEQLMDVAGALENKLKRIEKFSKMQGEQLKLCAENK